jgi:hypothetical protein
MSFIMRPIRFASTGYVIEGSGLFDGSSGYLSRTPDGASNRTTWTFHVIAKRFNSSGDHQLFEAGSVSGTRNFIQYNSAGKATIASRGPTTQLDSAALFRDPSAWHDLLFVWDTSDSTAADRVKIYSNGVRLTDLATDTQASSSLNSIVNTAIIHTIGRASWTAANFGNYALARVALIDGQALTPASFGETTDDGFWSIKDISELTFGTNGFLLEGQNVAAGADSHAGGTPAEQQVVALLHMNGDDASTTFTDSSSYTQTFTAGGNAQIDTAQKKYGTASGLFDGTGDRLVMTADSHFAHGTAWTAEGWFRKTANGNGTEAVYYQGDDHYVFYARAASSTNSGVSFYFNGTSIAGSTSMTDSTWHHWAMVRDGATARAFIDGTSVGTGSPSWATSTASDVVNIGSQNASNYFTGHIDEVRVTTGLARYTGNFTAPSAAFTDPATANHFTKSGTITATNDSPTNGDA